METALLVALGLVVGLAIAGLAIFVGRQRAPVADNGAAQLADQRVVELGARVQAMGELLAKAQTQLQSSMHERLDAVTQHLGTSMQTSTKHTTENLQKLNERLAVIDHAQKNITELATQVTSLQSVLTNKQSRGAFGQAQMEEIVRDGLPSTLYDFQFTLSNRNRPDCIIRIPGNQALLVIDSKFPLEGFDLLRNAATDEDKKTALAQVRATVTKHVGDIAEKYLIPGEVQTPAIMFVPSESLYADLHDGFADVIQKAHRANVMVVSPNILMLAINTIRTVMKDARMREQADLIKKEVGILLNDVRLLAERVGKLQSHFNQADADIKNILISTSKITGRAERIEKVELAPTETPQQLS